MGHEFDIAINRTGTASLKWDFRSDMTGVPDILPMWVADMDFAAPPAVIEAVRARAGHGVYGYTGQPESYFDAAREWFRVTHNWEPDRNHMVVTPGVVPALNMAVRAFTSPGDRVILQPPVYYPFMWAVENNDRKIVNNPLRRERNTWRMDLEDLEKKIDSHTRMIILCSPHNPVARVWTKKELTDLMEICSRHDILVVTDEIHADLVMPGHRHHPLETVAPGMVEGIITCTSPSKTFNLAGLQVSTIIIPSAPLREKFASAMKSTGLGLSNPFGMVAAEAAYRLGMNWLNDLRQYIQDNHTFLTKFCSEKIPWARPMPLEGTYLAWIDCSGAGLDDGRLKEWLRTTARVWLDEGPMFGPGGEGFQRMNIACPRATLSEALERIAAAPFSGKG